MCKTCTCPPANAHGAVHNIDKGEGVYYAFLHYKNENYVIISFCAITFVQGCLKNELFFATLQ